MVEGQELEGPDRPRPPHDRRAIRGPGVPASTPAAPPPPGSPPPQAAPPPPGPPASHAPTAPAVSWLDPEGEEGPEGRVQILLKKQTNKQTNIELDKQLQRRKVFLSDDENTIKEQKESSFR